MPSTQIFFWVSMPQKKSLRSYDPDCSVMPGARLPWMRTLACRTRGPASRYHDDGASCVAISDHWGLYLRAVESGAHEGCCEPTQALTPGKQRGSKDSVQNESLRTGDTLVGQHRLATPSSELLGIFTFHTFVPQQAQIRERSMAGGLIGTLEYERGPQSCSNTNKGLC